MKQRFKAFIKRYWIAVWIIAVSVCWLSAYTFAAYTKTNRAKNVVARYGDVETRFSSNYLVENGSEKPIYVAQNDNKFGDTILISNFPQTNPTYHYDTVINYKLEMKLGYMNGTTFTYLNEANRDSFGLGKRYITANIEGYNGYQDSFTFGYVAPENDGDPPTYVYNSTINQSNNQYCLSLPGTSSASDKITLVFSEDQKTSLFADPNTYANDLYLEITATPDPPGSYTELSVLRAQICLAQSVKVEQITWTGNFNETGYDTSGSGPHPVTSPLDGFNYVIQGMGSGTAKLSWNSDYIELNEQFLIEELGIAPVNLPTADSTTHYKEITFAVDSETKNRYDIQFYRSGTQADTNYDTWEELESYVTFTFPYTAPSQP